MTLHFKPISADHARAAFRFDAETGLLYWREAPREAFGTDHHWRARNTRFAGKVAGHRHTCTVGKTYIQVRWLGKIYYAHRIIWTMLFGAIPEGMEVDHEDGDGTNNRPGNFRLVTNSGNKRNQRKMVTNTSGHTGVYRCGRMWRAAVTIDNKLTTLGRFYDFDEAVACREMHNRANAFHAGHGSDRPL